MELLTAIEQILESNESRVYRWRMATIYAEAWLRKLELDRVYKLCPVWELQ